MKKARIHKLRTICQEIVSAYVAAFIFGVIAVLLLFVFGRPYVGAVFAVGAWVFACFAGQAIDRDGDEDAVDVDVDGDDDDTASGDHR